jgi:hypothetical protein
MQGSVMKLLEETGVVSLIIVAEMATTLSCARERTVTAGIFHRCYRTGFC